MKFSPGNEQPYHAVTCSFRLNKEDTLLSKLTGKIINYLKRKKLYKKYFQ